MAKKIRVNFKGVPKEIRRGGAGSHLPPGDYPLKVVSSELREGPKANYLRWRFQVAGGEHKGATLYSNTSFSPDALFGLRNLIHAALGKNVAGKVVEFDPETLYGKTVGGSVEDNEFKDKNGNSKISSNVATIFPVAELGDSAEAETDDDDEEEEEVEEEEDDDLEDVDVEEL